MARRDQWDEEMAVRAAQAGSLAAFDHLVRLCRPSLLALALTRAGREEAEDAVQEAFLTAYKALPSLKQPDKFRMWLGAILRHRLSQGRTARPAPLPLDDLLLENLPSLRDDWHTHDSLLTLAEAIGSLPSDQAECLRLFCIEELSIREIASRLPASEATVKWRLHVGREALRRRLGLLVKEPQ